MASERGTTRRGTAKRGTGIRALAVASLAAGGVVAMPGQALAAICDRNNPAARGDLDGDSRTDVVVGMPELDGGAGAVDARGTHTDSRVLRPADLHAGTGKGNRFGATVVITDLDGDGCADLVVGSPGEGAPNLKDKAAAKRFGAGRSGQVHIVFGSPSGLLAKGAGMLAHPSSAGGDEFGAALAVVPRQTSKGLVRDLYVGAPGADVGGAKGAGEVFRFTIAPDAKKRIAVTGGESRHQGGQGVPDRAEAGDRFGAVLGGVEGGTDSNGVLVGTPDEDLGDLRDAGSVTYLPTTRAGRSAPAETWTQDSVGVPGEAEAGDRFGAAVGSRGAWAAVGAPGENVGDVHDAGAVQIFERIDSGAEGFAPRRQLTQESTDGPGELEPDDRFGEAVTVGLGLACARQPSVAIGAPGEDVGTVADAGSVTVAPLADRAACWPRVLTQGANGVGGVPEPGDHLGAALGALRGNAGWGARYADALVMGAPGEDVEARVDTGSVQPAEDTFTVDGVAKPWLQFSGGLAAGHRYGTVLPGSSD